MQIKINKQRFKFISMLLLLIIFPFYNLLLMDLTLLKEFFSFLHYIQKQLQSKQSLFSKIPAYSLYRLIAKHAEPNINSVHVNQFIKSFNWSLSLPSSNDVNANISHKLVDCQQSNNPQEILDKGAELIVKYWGTNGQISFDEFAVRIKGQQELPDHKNREVIFQKKKQLFETILQQIQNLLKLEAIKKAVYNEYRNMTDLFEMLTPNNLLTDENLHRLFQMFGERKTEKDMQMIKRRIQLPCTFDHFLSLFKYSSSKQKEFKVHYSSKRSRKREDSVEKSFTTPRKPKNIVDQSSTKITKHDVLTDLKREKYTVSEFSLQQHDEDWGILAQILQVEEDFDEQKMQLLRSEAFDLELAYERHGKKFEKLLNQRYGVCNFTSFVRFIIPQTYEQRYLSFIRYVKSNTLPEFINEKIDQLLVEYQNKEEKIKSLWGSRDKELTFRSLCLPRQEAITGKKLSQYFTKREIGIICDRMDPHRKGFIELTNFY